jgi:hypothetical protein
VAQVKSHTYQFKRGTEEAALAKNPLLLYGEPLVVKCSNGAIKLKIGDGINHYKDLPFIGEDKIITYKTYFDFPNFGKESIIYQAEDRHMLYQWNPKVERYEELCIDEDGIEMIDGGSLFDLN